MATAPDSPRIGSVIGELRRLSGLTWEQLSQVLGMSRSSLHSWASGESRGRTDEEHLLQVLSVIRCIDRGSASHNRTELFAVRDDGMAFDLLLNRQYHR